MKSFFSSCLDFHAWAGRAHHVFIDAQSPAQTWHLAARSFEEQRNLRGPKCHEVIGLALSSVSSINVQFSI